MYRVQDDVPVNTDFAALTLGTVYIYNSAISMTDPVATLQNSGSNMRSNFGQSLAITKEYVFVSSGDSLSDGVEGCVHVYRKVDDNTNSWEFWSEISSGKNYSFSYKSKIVAKDGYLVITGRDITSSNLVYSAYIFELDSLNLKYFSPSISILYLSKIFLLILFFY
jgi:hypothetical protein